MKAIAPAAAAKLAKLVPMLATDRDGELLVTVRAIRRTLDSAGLDLHDLAAAVSLPTAPPRHIEPDPVAVIWAELSAREKHAWLCSLHHVDDEYFSDWERTFVADLFGRSGRWMSVVLTRRQEAALNQILWKAAQHGVHP